MSKPLIALIVIVSAMAIQAPSTGAVNQTTRYPLESVDGLHLHNVAAEPAILEGKRGLRLTRATELDAPSSETLATIAGPEFSSGTIEAEIAGSPAPGVEGARGFVGIAFRVQKDLRSYDAFYLRPTNGRAEDQELRNHSTQYISHPDWPWFRLRMETPSRYESYVDLVAGAWTKIRIEVNGSQARLYVHGQEQPALIVTDVKSGVNGSGAVALWMDPSTIAHFRDLTVEAR